MPKRYIYILIMFGVTYLIRVLPLTLIRKKIQNRYIKSFLYYVPLSLMTFPAIVEATSSPFAGGIALILGIIASYKGAPMLNVSIICCLAVFIIELFLV